jgi:hypothetical protein
MKLELLPNELLLEIFEFFDGVDLLDAFNNLNFRINDLLFIQFRHYRFNLETMFDRGFHLLFKQYLPLIVDRVVSIQVPELDRNSKRLDKLLSSGFTFRQFTSLRLLSFGITHPMTRTNVILKQAYDLAHLTHLDASPFSIGQYTDLSCFMNNVWRLPKLIHLSSL